MNAVQLIGRVGKDPEVRYGGQSQQAVARFSIAINRGKKSDGTDLGADWPNIVCFGKTAELVEKYVHKGRLLGVTGKIQTGSYEKDGKKYYTTEVIADRVEFLDKAGDEQPVPSEGSQNKNVKPAEDDYQVGFTELTDEDIPFGA